MGVKMRTWACGSRHGREGVNMGVKMERHGRVNRNMGAKTRTCSRTQKRVLESGYMGSGTSVYFSESYRIG